MSYYQTKNKYLCAFNCTAMDFSQVKMVVSDMDGTLLNSNHEVSSRFFELFQELKRQEITFVAASGRQYNSIVDKLDAIKNDIVVIAENGGFVMERENELVATPLSQDHKNQVLSILKTIPGIHPVLCAKHSAHLLGNDTKFVEKLKEYYTEYELLDNLKDFEGEILKIAIYHFESSERFVYPFVKQLENELKVKVSGENWVDISSPNAHKGYALQKVQELYNVSPSETMVFGDYNNDLEMLALADFSFAMANAHPNVQKAAKYKTTSNDNFGVERILEQLLGV